jgi:hypothetical protein
VGLKEVLKKGGKWSFSYAMNFSYEVSQADWKEGTLSFELEPDAHVDEGFMSRWWHWSEEGLLHLCPSLNSALGRKLGFVGVVAVEPSLEKVYE